jgi:hypothetical protein
VLLELLVGEVQNDTRSLYTVYIDDEDKDLSAAFDARAGEWPTAVRTELEAIARECLAKYKHRCTVRAALQRLVRLERDHCQPTIEEQQLAQVRRPAVPPQHSTVAWLTLTRGCWLVPPAWR